MNARRADFSLNVKHKMQHLAVIIHFLENVPVNAIF